MVLVSIDYSLRGKSEITQEQKTFEKLLSSLVSKPRQQLTEIFYFYLCLGRVPPSISMRIHVSGLPHSLQVAVG